MNYEEAIKEVARRGLVKRIWKKVDSGFYPEIDEELKLLAIQKQIDAGEYKSGFWNLIKFLIKDLLVKTESDLSVEKKELANIIGRLTDQEEVQRQFDVLAPLQA
jgi:hypothetical protein